MSTSKSNQATAAAAALRVKGWTLRPAAKRLGVSTTHLHYVVTNRRTSASLLRRVANLPANPNRQP
jgi:hypothetical protein